TATRPAPAGVSRARGHGRYAATARGRAPAAASRRRAGHGSVRRRSARPFARPAGSGFWWAWGDVIRTIGTRAAPIPAGWKGPFAGEFAGVGRRRPPGLRLPPSIVESDAKQCDDQQHAVFGAVAAEADDEPAHRRVHQRDARDVDRREHQGYGE